MLQTQRDSFILESDGSPGCSFHHLLGALTSEPAAELHSHLLCDSCVAATHSGKP